MTRAVLAAALLAAAGWAGAAWAELTVNPTRYSCERGVEIPVAYVDDADGSAAVLLVEGRQITLLRDTSAPDARYAWPSDGSGYVWRTRGSDGRLSWFDAEKKEEVVLYGSCAAG